MHPSVILNQGLQSIKSINKLFLHRICFPHKTNTHYTIRYSAALTEKPQPTLHQLPPKTHKQNMVEKIVLKMW